MKTKKAISDIVSTVLIIMIAVAAVGIIGAIVVPMVRNSLQGGTACLNALSDVSIELQGTCINGNDNSIKVQVRKGSDASVSLDSFIVQIIDTAGDSEPRTIENVTMSLGQIKTYTLEDVSVDAESITLAPVVKVGSSTKQCDSATSKVKLVACK